MGTQDRLAAGDYFENETFAGLDLQGADLSRKEFFRCTFQNSKLQESRWDRARLEECVFDGCDLTGMKPMQMIGYGLEFKGCKLMGVSWGDLAPNPRLAFADCNLRYSSFAGVNLRDTVFERCRVTEVTFADSDLTEAEFPGSDLAESTFRNCQLRKADFSQARGVFVDPARNRVKDAQIPLESAVLLAMSFGLRVSGFGESDE